MTTRTSVVPGDFGDSLYAGMTVVEGCACGPDDEPEWGYEFRAPSGKRWREPVYKCETCGEVVETLDCG